MSTQRRVETVTKYVVNTDTYDGWCSGDTYAEAVAAYNRSITMQRQQVESLRRRGVPEDEVREEERDIPTRITGITRRTSTTTYETTEEQLPYPPEDQ